MVANNALTCSRSEDSELFVTFAQQDTDSREPAEALCDTPVGGAFVEHAGRGVKSMVEERLKEALNCSVMNGQIFLTDDILDNLLCQLPLASLGRLICTCKAFNSALNSQEFGFVFQRHAPRYVHTDESATGSTWGVRSALPLYTSSQTHTPDVISHHMHERMAAASGYRRRWYPGFGESFSWRVPSSPPPCFGETRIVCGVCPSRCYPGAFF